MADINLLSKIGYKVVGKAQKVARVVYQHRADIFMVGGATGLVVSTVHVCKHTTKANELLEKAKNDISNVHIASENYDKLEYTTKDKVTDYATIGASTAVGFMKEYWKDALMFGASAGMLIISRQVWKHQTVQLSTELMNAGLALAAYRERVKEEVGENKEAKLFYNLTDDHMTETSEDGTEVKEEKDILVASEEKFPDRPYAVVYSKGTSIYYKNDSKLILNELYAASDWANTVCAVKGHIMLNDILERLGMKKQKRFNKIGIVYNPKNPNRMLLNGFNEVYRTDESNKDILEKGLLIEFPGFHNIWDELPEEFD